MRPKNCRRTFGANLEKCTAVSRQSLLGKLFAALAYPL